LKFLALAEEATQRADLKSQYFNNTSRRSGWCGLKKFNLFYRKRSSD